MSNIRLTYINIIEIKLSKVEEYVEYISKHKLQIQTDGTDLNKNKIHRLYNKTYEMNKHVETYGGILNNNYKDYKNILDKWIQQLDLLHWALFGLSDDLEYMDIENKMEFILKKLNNILNRFIKMNII